MHRNTILSIVTVASLSLKARAASGTGQTTRYWDCCKPSCAWSGKASVSAPVTTCDKNDSPLTNPNAVSGCDGGTAFTCTNNSPWAVNDQLAYGFAATAIAGGTEEGWCCACYKLTFTSGAAAGKTMIVQSTNTGGDLGSNHFDIMMPGGGLGIFDGCTAEFGTTLPGERYGGTTSQSMCDSMPTSLQAGCNWRYNWFGDSDNPGVEFEQVQCPAAIIAVSGCKRDDDSTFPAVEEASAGTSAGTSTVSSIVSTRANDAATSIPVTSPTSSSTSTTAAASTPVGMKKCKNKKRSEHLAMHQHK
ncbi:RlpA-like double-psi beta-barrel-protein domain-containing protein-containing protein [Pseudomassariella vexata]|uniref:Cellulase n=1 Tax=Pseudomassariella vexata TaxID=1141098 RepID=A0A1Y2DDV3_9PEZI|nr:RlpA-like double-psi beta-barrel-protein domain-containing protein-containing protein [Pseudomassariella vexata]ORY57429.1 RlpA-like double-psi beta-barrel-protein domain-containing protein-containing protein [Pseudomassariella vexata]